MEKNNSLSQLEDLLNKGVLTQEEFEKKKEQILQNNPELSAEKETKGEKWSQLVSRLSKLYEKLKELSLNHKKISCVIFALLFAVVGFLPGFLVGRNHPTNVNISFGGSDNAFSEVSGKGSSKNPYKFNEDIVFEVFNTECGRNVTYTVNISRILRQSALNRYYNDDKDHDSAGLIVTISADWEGDDIDYVSLAPVIGVVYKNEIQPSACLSDTFFDRNRRWSDEIVKGKIYKDVVIEQFSYDYKDFDHVRINYYVKNNKGEMVGNKIIVEFDPKIIES